MAITRQETGKVEFEGAVLSVYTSGRFAMSDYGVARIAVVWDGSKVIETGLGYEDIGSLDYAKVDATPEVVAAAAAYQKDQAARAIAESTVNRLFTEWMTVHKGDAVVVVKGRKVAHGTKGVVAWMGDSGFGTSVGLAIEGVSGLTFTAITNVKRDHSDAAAAAELDAAHESAKWFDANVYAAKAKLKATGVQKGDTVTPKSGAYAGRNCRVIWTGTRNGEARVGVVPKPARGRRSTEAADWLPVEAVLGAA
jgi:hypothetical protein